MARSFSQRSARALSCFFLQVLHTGCGLFFTTNSLLNFLIGNNPGRSIYLLLLNLSIKNTNNAKEHIYDNYI